MKTAVTFRLMTFEDMDAVLTIERSSFTTPWSREAFYNELMNNQFAHYLLLEEEEKIVGFCGLWVVVDEAQITNLAILPVYRGKKFGEALLLQSMELARDLGAIKLSLEVRVSNKIAQSLYRKLGFREGGIRKNYYSDDQEDALVMWVNLV